MRSRSTHLTNRNVPLDTETLHADMTSHHRPSITDIVTTLLCIPGLLSNSTRECAQIYPSCLHEQTARILLRRSVSKFISSYSRQLFPATSYSQQRFTTSEVVARDNRLDQRCYMQTYHHIALMIVSQIVTGSMEKFFLSTNNNPYDTIR